MAPNSSEQIGEQVPYLRRYARALTGSQDIGDDLAATTLEALLSQRDPASFSVKVHLFKLFHQIWLSTGKRMETEEDELRKSAQARLAKLTPNSREALLLNTIESFNRTEIAEILSLDESEVAELLNRARDELADAIAGSILIVEDEAFISMDLAALVSEIGHRVTGVARTHGEAISLAAKEMPDLILADIQLADDSSGIEAVKEVMTDLGHRPVIFITAFPERLLSGAGPEPAFLITKPYSPDAVRSAVSQAMFFSLSKSLTT